MPRHAADRSRQVDAVADRSGADAVLRDDEVVERVRAGETALFEILMRRYNQRLFRALHAILRDDAEAEDVLQDAYVRAYLGLDRFRGEARFSTWLTRIAIHEALRRRRRSSRFRNFDPVDDASDPGARLDPGRSPEDAASSDELRGVLDRAIGQMPETLRSVFVLREVEGLDTEETAECLGLTANNVKVRLHRARGLLRDRIDRRLGTEVRRLHQFAGARCDAVVARVLQRLHAVEAESEGRDA